MVRIERILKDLIVLIMGLRAHENIIKLHVRFIFHSIPKVIFKERLIFFLNSQKKKRKEKGTLIYLFAISSVFFLISNS